MTPERIAEIKPLLNGRRRLAALSVAKELLAAVESLQAENARLRAALVETIECLYGHAIKSDVDLDPDQLERDYKRLTAAIDAALEGKE